MYVCHSYPGLVSESFLEKWKKIRAKSGDMARPQSNSCIYACMYVYMYVSMHVCMFVCMYVWILTPHYYCNVAGTNWKASRVTSTLCSLRRRCMSTTTISWLGWARFFWSGTACSPSLSSETFSTGLSSFMWISTTHYCPMPEECWTHIRTEVECFFFHFYHDNEVMERYVL